MILQPADVLVVVPAWNEERSVATVVESVRARGYDVLVVDDGSSDRTALMARDAGAHVARLPVNLGVGAALRCGFRWACERGYQAVVQCDADGQHPAEAIDGLREACNEFDVDMLIGSRFADGTPMMHVGQLRRVVMRLLARSATKATGTAITDATSGFRIIREPLLSQFAATFPAHYLGDTFEAVVSAGRAGYRVKEISVDLRDRTHGQSSASPLAAARFTIRCVVVVLTRLHFEIVHRPAEQVVRPG